MAPVLVVRSLQLPVRHLWSCGTRRPLDTHIRLRWHVRTPWLPPLVSPRLLSRLVPSRITSRSAPSLPHIITSALASYPALFTVPRPCTTTLPLLSLIFVNIFDYLSLPT
ncbi:hypothetical protein VTO73DRAFT_13394 [Trametes versicolor]